MSSPARILLTRARRGRRPDPRVRLPLRACAALAAAMGTLALAGVAPAQEVPPGVAVVRLQDEYEAERLSCQGAVRARKAHQPEYELFIQRAGQAEPESEAWNRAQRRLLELSHEIDGAQDRVTDVCGDAEAARQAYLDGLDALRRDLERDLLSTESQARQRDIQALLADVENRYAELEEERGGLQLQLVMRPVIDIDPRNTPDDVRRKAVLLENLIAMADTTLASLDVEVERLQSRLRIQRGAENFQANVTRYGDTRTPVRTDPREGDERAGVAADSTALSGQTLEERIEALRSARLNLEHYQERLRERLGEFRAYLRRIS